jgi:hypothetical protein
MGKTNNGKVTIESLDAEIAAICRRIKARQQAAEKDRERAEQIRQERHRLVLFGVVGVAGAVQVRFRSPACWAESKLNDLKGTVLEVRRSRATVDFAGERWDYALKDLILAGEDQGISMAWHNGVIVGPDNPHGLFSDEDDAE